MTAPYSHRVFSLPPAIRPDPQSGPLRKLFGGSQYVLSRAACAFRYQKLEGRKPSRELLQAIALEADLSGASERTGIYITCKGGHLQVWTWDASLFGLLPDPVNLKIVPESLLHEPGDGLVLRQCLEGFEGQVWQDGILVASRWWKQAPGLDTWIQFCRASGLTGVEQVRAVPVPEEAALASDAPPPNRTPVRTQVRHLSWSHAVLAVLGFVLLPAGYFAARNLAITSELGRLEAERSELSLVTAGRQVENRSLMALRQTLDPFVAEVRSNDPLTGLADTIELLMLDQINIERFQFSEGMLELVFEGSRDYSEPDLVRRLEAIPSASNVRIDPLGRTGNRLLTLTIEEPRND